MKNQDLQFVTFEQAKRLKQDGFDWPCNSWYGEELGNIHKEAAILNHNFAFGINAPTVALALKWMRDVKELMCGVAVRATNDGYAMYEGSFRYGIIGLRGSNMCDTYESAESALLDELLTLLETK